MCVCRSLASSLSLSQSLSLSSIREQSKASIKRWSMHMCRDPAEDCLRPDASHLPTLGRVQMRDQSSQGGRQDPTESAHHVGILHISHSQGSPTAAIRAHTAITATLAIQPQGNHCHRQDKTHTKKARIPSWKKKKELLLPPPPTTPSLHLSPCARPPPRRGGVCDSVFVCAAMDSFLAAGS